MPSTTKLRNWKSTLCFSRGAALLAILLAGLAAPLHAQFTFVDLYDFSCGSGTSVGGCYPGDRGQLALGTDGNFYATTSTGGIHDFGTIFMMSTSGVETDLWPFDGINGWNSLAGLTLASDGNFYGTAELGGANSKGTVFRFTPPATVTLLHSFASTEGVPLSSPVQGADGNLYGVTNKGTTYSIALTTGTYQLLTPAPGAVSAPLLLASDGNLYGGTYTGGSTGNGAIFRMSTPGGAIKIIHNFTGTDGAAAEGGLVQAPDGNLYGTTNQGGPNNNGEIFKMTPAGKITVLHTFDPNGVLDGDLPAADLMVASDGYLYGVNSGGGAGQFGTIFRISTSGSFTKLFDFTGTTGSVPGAYSATGLTQHTNGSLYGLAYRGGANDNGTFFSLLFPNLTEILIIEGPIFVKPGVPVEILGNNLTHAIQVNFGGVQGTITGGSDTFLTATVPYAAVDGLVSVIYDTGLQTETVLSTHILPAVTGFDPPSGSVGTVVTINGGGFTGAKKVAFGTVLATSFTVLSPQQIQATVPTGAKTGKIGVMTPNGSAKSSTKFTVR